MMVWKAKCGLGSDLPKGARYQNAALLTTRAYGSLIATFVGQRYLRCNENVPAAEHETFGPQHLYATQTKTVISSRWSFDSRGSTGSPSESCASVYVEAVVPIPEQRSLNSNLLPTGCFPCMAEAAGKAGQSPKRRAIQELRRSALDLLEPLFSEAVVF